MYAVAVLLFSFAVGGKPVVFNGTVYSVLCINTEKGVFKNIVFDDDVFAIINFYPAQVLQAGNSCMYDLKSINHYAIGLNGNDLIFFLAIQYRVIYPDKNNTFIDDQVFLSVMTGVNKHGIVVYCSFEASS